MKAKKKAGQHKPINIRLPIELYAKTQELAEKNDHSLSKTVTIIIRKHFTAEVA